MIETDLRALNPNRKSRREVFVDKCDEHLNSMKIESELES